MGCSGDSSTRISFSYPCYSLIWKFGQITCLASVSNPIEWGVRWVSQSKRRIEKFSHLKSLWAYQDSSVITTQSTDNHILLQKYGPDATIEQVPIVLSRLCPPWSIWKYRCGMLSSLKECLRSFLIPWEMATQNYHRKIKLSKCIVDQEQMKAMVAIYSCLSYGGIGTDEGISGNEKLWSLRKIEIVPSRWCTLSLRNLSKKVVNIKQSRKTQWGQSSGLGRWRDWCYTVGTAMIMVHEEASPMDVGKACTHLLE